MAAGWSTPSPCRRVSKPAMARSSGAWSGAWAAATRLLTLRVWLRQPVGWGQEGVTVDTLELAAGGALRSTGALESLPIDTLVLALGQHADSTFLRSVACIAFDAEGSSRVGRQLMAGSPGMFA